MHGTCASRVVTALLMATLIGIGGCEAEPRRELPTEAALDSVYGEPIDISLNGNVVEIVVTQDADQLRRGGSVWAKAGPYIYLFTPQTQELLEAYGGIGGVRVTTLDAHRRLVARALLERGTLNSVTWPRAINVAGRARVEGTQRPQTMVNLAKYGEEHTSFEYSRQYVGSD
jgi:hypothetical protein